jgi:hypothetical protein
VDLLGALQQFSRSIQRERQAKESVANAAQHVPKLKLMLGGKGEKMHIQFGKKNTNTNSNSNNSLVKEKKETSTTTTTTTTTPKTGQPMLLKKPRSAATPSAKAEEETAKEKIMQGSMLVGGLTIDDDGDGDDDGDDDKAELVPAKKDTKDSSEAAIGVVVVVAGGDGDGDGAASLDDDDDWNDFQGA